MRIAVNNLAGVPSIVFGLFGLGFFIIFVGGSMDALFYDDPRPVWGKPSILWASLTLAVLTLPVVIVTTEEALRTVPREIPRRRPRPWSDAFSDGLQDRSPPMRRGESSRA